jgi:hypothetical protein
VRPSAKPKLFAQHALPSARQVARTLAGSSHLLHEAAKLGGGHPRLVLVLLRGAARAASTVAASSASVSPLSSSTAKAAGHASSVSHAVYCVCLSSLYAAVQENAGSDVLAEG